MRVEEKGSNESDEGHEGHGGHEGHESDEEEESHEGHEGHGGHEGHEGDEEVVCNEGIRSYQEGHSVSNHPRASGTSSRCGHSTSVERWSLCSRWIFHCYEGCNCSAKKKT